MDIFSSKLITTFRVYQTQTYESLRAFMYAQDGVLNGSTREINSLDEAIVGGASDVEVENNNDAENEWDVDDDVPSANEYFEDEMAEACQDHLCISDRMVADPQRSVLMKTTKPKGNRLLDHTYIHLSSFCELVKSREI